MAVPARHSAYETPQPAPLVMPMGVVHVRHVRMCVTHGHMLMEMGVRLARRVMRTMRVVVVVLVVHVRMDVRHGFVRMFMFVTFRKVQPHANRHEQASGDKLECHRIAERDDCGGAAEKRCCRKIRPSARCTQMAERDDEQSKADAVAEKADDASEQRGREARQCRSRREAKY